jgi:hypothetical protein
MRTLQVGCNSAEHLTTHRRRTCRAWTLSNLSQLQSVQATDTCKHSIRRVHQYNYNFGEFSDSDPTSGFYARLTAMNTEDRKSRRVRGIDLLSLRRTRLFFRFSMLPASIANCSGETNTLQCPL